MKIWSLNGQTLFLSSMTARRVLKVTANDVTYASLGLPQRQIKFLGRSARLTGVMHLDDLYTIPLTR